MPLYEVQHIISLTPSQQDALASAITEIHSSKFTTPRMFVNVRFTDTAAVPMYVGGKRKRGNHILANVRVGGKRTQQEFDDLCTEVVAAWEKIVGGSGSGKGVNGNGAANGHGGEEDYSLRSCIVLGGLTAGYEAGFHIPPAGGDVNWLKENMKEFEKRAEAGDEEFQDLVQEIKERGLL